MAAGVLSYDLIELFESLPAGLAEPAPTPHLEFFVPDRLVVVDHLRQRTFVIAHAFGGANATKNERDAEDALDEIGRVVKEVRAESAEVTESPPTTKTKPREDGPLSSASSASFASFAFKAVPDLDDDTFGTLVTKLQTHITRGDVFQIVASRTFSLPCPDPLAAYAELRATEPSPYLFYVRGAETTLFGASPETAVKVHGEPRVVTVRPIAGTAPRGRTPEGDLDRDLDARREAALRLDTKEVAEHMMLVDLARNDVARVSRPGSRRVGKLLTVERFTHVMHLVSEVEGALAPGLDALHAYAAAMNMGTLVGAPKVRAAQLLREYEASRRGAYGGAVGYLTHGGEMDTAIVIRAALVRDGVAFVRAGAGIVHDSTPAGEAQETRRKAEAVLRAIARSQRDR
jgi:anthranilate synthase component 1